VGVTVRRPDGADHRWLFAESPSRFVLALDPAAVGEVHRRHRASGVPAAPIGDAGGDRFTIAGLVDLPLADVVAAWRGRLPAELGHGTTQG